MKLKMSKRVRNLFLCVVLVVGLMPVTALAQKTGTTGASSTTTTENTATTSTGSTSTASASSAATSSASTKSTDAASQSTSSGSAATATASSTATSVQSSAVATTQSAPVTLTTQSASQDLSKYVVASSSSITVNGTDISQVQSVNIGDIVKVALYWQFPNTVDVKKGDVFTYTLPKNISWTDVENGVVRDSSGNTIGNYTISNQTVTVTYITDMGSNAYSDGTFTGTITSSASGGNDGSTQTFDFPGIGKYTLPVNANKSVAIEKSHSGSGNLYAQTLKVTSTGTNTNVVITDAMGTYLGLADGTVKVYTDSSLTTEYTGSYSVTGNTAGAHGFVATIDSMSDGQVLYVGYTVNVNSKAALTSDATTHQNTATFTYDTDKTGKSNTDQIDATATFSTKKDATVDGNNITWSIYVDNADGSDIGGTIVKDIRGTGDNDKWGDPSTVTIQSSSDGASWSDAGTTSWATLSGDGYVFPAGSTAVHYRITFTTTAQGANKALSTNWYYNRAEVTPYGDKNMNKQYPEQYAGIGTDIYIHDKTCISSDNTTTPQWQTKIYAPADTDLTNVVYTDNVETGSGHTLNQDSIKVYSDEGLTQEVNSGFTVSDKSSSGFKITWPKIAKGTTYYVVYTTTITDTTTSKTVKNTANVVCDQKNGSDSNATYDYKVVRHLGKSGSEEFVAENNYKWNGIIDWTLKIHGLGSSASVVSIEDALPGNMSYVAGSAAISLKDGTAFDSSNCAVDASVVGKITFSLSGDALAAVQAGKSVHITYKTKLIDIAKALADGGKDYENSATLSVNGSAETPTVAKAWGQLDGTVSKSAKYDASTAPLANYTITVNPAALDLVPNSTTLTLTDVMGTGLEYKRGTLKIDGADISTLSGYSLDWNASTRTLTLTIPDSKAMTITYDALVTLKVGTAFTTDNASNSAALSGSSSTAGSSSTSLQGEVVKSEFGGGSTDNTLNIYKYSNGNKNAALAGAGFTVEKMTINKDKADTTKWTLTDDSAAATITSLNNGYASASLKSDTVYRVAETTVPDGFKAADTFYIVFPGADAAGNNNYSGITVTDGGKTINLVVSSDASFTKEVDDAAVTHDVSISKVDATTSHEIAGAKLTITDANRTTVATWTSGSDGTDDSGALKTHTVSLPAGTYTLAETTAPTGYQKAEAITFTVNADGTVDKTGASAVTMKDASDTTSVGVSKTWNDADDQDGVRPTSVTVHLLKAAGTETASDTGKAVTLDAGNNWAASFTDLAKNEDGKAVAYTVSEDAVSSYTASVSGTAADGFTVTNTLITHDVSISKVDATTSHEIAGAELSIIDASKATVASWTSEANKDHQVSLPAGTYTLTETAAPTGYQKAEAITFTVNADGKVAIGGTEVAKVTMKDASDTTDISTTKTWVDDGNASNSRPESIGLTLQRTYTNATGEKVTESIGDPVTVKGGASDAAWTQSWGSLPSTIDGSAVTYSVLESAVVGYTPTYSGTNVTNTLTPGVTSFTAKKTWADSNNLYKLQPESVSLQLQKTVAGSKNAVDVGDSVTIDAVSGWSYMWTELPTVEDGKAIAYSVVEMNVDTNYTSKVSDGAVTNTLTTHEVTVSKVSATDGETEIAGAELSITDASKTTVASWTSEANKDHQVSLPAGAYTLHESASKAQGFAYDLAQDITFTVNADGTVDKTSGNKIVMSDALTKHNVQISKVDIVSGSELAGAVLAVTGTTAEGKSFSESWTSGTAVHEVSLPAGTYTLTETAAPTGYQKAEAITFTVNADGKVAIGGTEVAKVTMKDASDTTSVGVSKTWNDADDQDGVRPTSVTVHLLADGKDTGKTVTLDAGNKWAASFTGLAKNEDGKAVAYTVSEDAVSGYATSVSGTAADGFAVTNTHATETTSLNVSKVWSDNNDQDGVRPTSVTVRLLADGKDTGKTVTLDANGNWAASFTGLAKNAGGKAIAYTISEDVPKGYSASVVAKADQSGYTITNTHIPGKTAVNVTKAWQDDNDLFGLRPASIIVHLLANGTNTGKTITLDATNNWTSSFTELDEKTDGKTIIYTVSEEAVAEYTANVEAAGISGASFTLTNSIAKHDVTISKVTATGGATEIAGATLTITKNIDEQNKTIDSWTSEAGKNHVAHLAAGTYTLTEVTAPQGYEKAESITFTVDANGNVTSTTTDAVTDSTVTMKDAYTNRTIIVSKVDAADGATELAGAELTVTGKTDNGMDIAPITWTSEEGKTYEATLPMGSYTLHENTAPAGYDFAQDIAFTVNADGTVTSAGKTVEGNAIIMKDATHKVSIAKVSATSSQMLAGAQFEIASVDGKKLSNGETTMTWTSASTASTIDLAAGTYILTEKSAPEGYAVEDKPLTFTVAADGSVTTGSSVQAADAASNAKITAQGSTIAITFADDMTTSTVDVSKVDAATSHEIAGAKLTITGTTIEGSTVSATETAGTAWTSVAGKTHEVKLVPGTYTLTETTAPNGYAKAESIDFTVNKDGSVTSDAYQDGKLVMKDATDTVEKSVTKTWSDGDNYDGIRPSSVTVHLSANGDQVQTATLSASNNWSATWSNLPEYRDGAKIAYTVSEDAVAGYSTSIVSSLAGTTFAITNSHTPNYPITPQSPDTPEYPDYPDTPGTPDTPDTPEEGEVIEDNATPLAAKTADFLLNNAIPLSALAIASLGIAVFAKRRRDEADEESHN